jgi:hypothetical protein
MEPPFFQIGAKKYRRYLIAKTLNTLWYRFSSTYLSHIWKENYAEEEVKWERVEVIENTKQEVKG